MWIKPDMVHYPPLWVSPCLITRDACDETNTMSKSMDSRARESGSSPLISLNNLEKVAQPPCNSGSSTIKLGNNSVNSALLGKLI